MSNKKIVTWSKIIIALFFLFNPNIGIVDILPDFIGYILLCASISRIAVIDDRLSVAHDMFTRMIYITIIRFASLFVTFGFLPMSDQAMSILLFSFGFDVLELITVIPAIVKLFDGLLYLASRHDGEAICMCHKRSKYKTHTEKVRNTIVIFAFAKALFGTLPEFSSLFGQGWDESIWGRMNQFTGMFRVIGATISLVFGIVFLIKVVKYILLIKKDIEFFNRLAVLYEKEILSRPDYLARRAVVVAFGYFSAAAIFSIDFILDGYNVVPDVLSALCLIAGLLIVKKYITNWKSSLAVSAIYLISALLSVIFEYSFASKYFIEAIAVDPKTYNLYVFVCVAEAISAVMFVITMYVILRGPISAIIDHHTGFSMTLSDTYNPTEKIKQLHMFLKRRLSILIVLSAVLSVLSIASKIFVITLGFLWLIGFCISIVYTILTFKIFGEIKTQIDYKYMLS